MNSAAFNWSLKRNVACNSILFVSHIENKLVWLEVWVAVFHLMFATVINTFFQVVLLALVNTALNRFCIHLALYRVIASLHILWTRLPLVLQPCKIAALPKKNKFPCTICV